MKGTSTNTFHDLTPIPPATHYSQAIEIDIEIDTTNKQDDAARKEKMDEKRSDDPRKPDRNK